MPYTYKSKKNGMVFQNITLDDNLQMTRNEVPDVISLDEVVQSHTILGSIILFMRRFNLEKINVTKE